MEDKKFKEEVVKYWDAGSVDYDTAPGHGLFEEEEKQEWIKALREIVPEGAKVLDVGCGTGFLTLLLAEMGHTVKGLDISEGMQADAKRKVKEQGLEERVSFTIGDAEKLDEPENEYDVVINRHLLWTLPHPGEAIDSWIKVVKPGGKVIIIDGDWKAYANKSKERDNAEHCHEGEHEHGHSHEEGCEHSHEHGHGHHGHGHKGHGGRVYTKEMNDNLPSRSGKKEVADYIQREGVDAQIIRLTNVEDIERKLFADDEWLSSGEHKRFAYILTRK